MESPRSASSLNWGTIIRNSIACKMPFGECFSRRIMRSRSGGRAHSKRELTTTAIRSWHPQRRRKHASGCGSDHTAFSRLTEEMWTGFVEEFYDAGAKEVLIGDIEEDQSAQVSQSL